MRQIVLDTETTGLDPQQGHRIIEIGCVELINRKLTGNNYHQYLQPDREIDAAAIEVHGITNQFLQDKPRFVDIANDFFEYIRDAELIIHNAPFDVGFINQEIRLMAQAAGSESFAIESLCTVTDTLKMARTLHPGQKNNLDALCSRYMVDNTQRTLHGALLDSEILADVYVAMTGGQTGLFEEAHGGAGEVGGGSEIRRLDPNRPPLAVIQATADELLAHEAWLDKLEKDSPHGALWRRLAENPS